MVVGMNGLMDSLLELMQASGKHSSITVNEVSLTQLLGSLTLSSPTARNNSRERSTFEWVSTPVYLSTR